MVVLPEWSGDGGVASGSDAYRKAKREREERGVAPCCLGGSTQGRERLDKHLI